MKKKQKLDSTDLVEEIVHKEHNISKSWKYFFKELICANKGTAFRSSLLIVVLSLLMIIKAKVIEKIIDTTSLFQWEDMIKQLMILIVIVVVTIVLNYWKIKLTIYFGASSSNYMKNNICYRILHSRYEDIRLESSGDVIKTINNDVEIVSNFLSNDMTNLLSQFVLFLFILCYLFIKKPMIGLVTFSYAPIGMYITYQINKRMGAYYPKIAQAEGVEVEPAALKEIAVKSQGDVRSAINTLQALADKDHTLEVKDVENMVTKDTRSDIFNAITGVLKSKTPAHVKEAMWIEEDPTLVMEYIAENIRNKCKKKLISTPDLL